MKAEASFLLLSLCSCVNLQINECFHAVDLIFTAGAGEIKQEHKNRNRLLQDHRKQTLWLRLVLSWLCGATNSFSLFPCFLSQQEHLKTAVYATWLHILTTVGQKSI